MYLIVWGILRDDRGRILLGRRSGARMADGLWNLPGGAAERDEDLTAAVSREVAEEVGIRVDPAAWTSLGVSRFDGTGAGGERVCGVSLFFVAQTWEGKPQPLEKTSEVGWFDPVALPPDCFSWLPRALQLHLMEGAKLTQQRGPMDEADGRRLCWTRLG